MPSETHTKNAAMILDNFALSNYDTCPGKFQLRMIEGWIPIRRKAALGFGGAVHAGLAEWYRTGDAVKAVNRLLELWPDSMPVDDFRTREKAATTIVEYVRTYPKESFKIIGFPEAPLVEKAFTIDTGLFLDCQNPTCLTDTDPNSDKCVNCGTPKEPLQYGGILDGAVEFSGKLYVLEHKTTSQMGPTYFLQFNPNNQITGYLWGLQQLTNLPVAGAIVNGIGVYKASPTKFDRHITTRTPEQIAEWLRHVLKKANDIARAKRTGAWEWRTGNCMMYGACDYHNVHVLANPIEREKRLEQDYVRETWSHTDREE